MTEIHIEETVAPATVKDRGAAQTDSPGSRRSWRAAIEIALLALFAFAMLFPVLWMLETSLKDGRDIYAVPAKFLGFEVTFEHYKDVFVQRGGSGASDLAVAFKNSAIVAGMSTLIATLLGVPAAWAYSRFSVKAKKD
jgi:multiple sugar transport system permease protein